MPPSRALLFSAVEFPPPPCFGYLAGELAAGQRAGFLGKVVGLRRCHHDGCRAALTTAAARLKPSSVRGDVGIEREGR